MAKTEIDVGRLCSAIQEDRRSLERFRYNRTQAVRQFVGFNWSENGSEKKIPLNLIALFVQVMGRHLIAKNPQVLLSTFNRQYRPTVKALQDWANQQIDRERVADKLRRVVVDALFSIGITRVAIANPGDSAMSGWATAAGQPTIQRIDLDDFFFDRHARDMAEVSHIGHLYRIPKEVAVEMIGKRAKDLAVSEDRVYDEQGNERLFNIGLGNQHTEEEFEDMVDLCEVYLPRHRRVLTLPADYITGATDDYDKPLLDQPWVGPYCGPYHILSYGVVPGNAMPKAPIMDLIDLHEAANVTLRKMNRTSERLKEVGLVAGSGSEDGKRIIEADDGEMVKVQNLQGVQQVAFSGQHLSTLTAMLIQFKDLFSFQGGNLELLGGRSPQAKTATQDKMLNENATLSVADLQDTTLTHVSSVLESWIWFHYQDPYTVQRTVKEFKSGRNVVRDIYPASDDYGEKRPLHVRDGDWESMQVRVDPYSMQHQTPQSKLAFLVQTVNQLIAPVLPLLQQQGIAIDWSLFLKKIGEYADQSDLEEILTIIDPPAEAQGSSSLPHDRTLPTSTSREYTRRNVSEQTPDSANRNAVTGLLGLNTGGNPQQTKKSA